MSNDKESGRNVREEEQRDGARRERDGRKMTKDIVGKNEERKGQEGTVIENNNRDQENEGKHEWNNRIGSFFLSCIFKTDFYIIKIFFRF